MFGSRAPSRGGVSQKCQPLEASRCRNMAMFVSESPSTCFPPPPRRGFLFSNNACPPPQCEPIVTANRSSTQTDDRRKSVRDATRSSVHTYHQCNQQKWWNLLQKLLDGCMSLKCNKDQTSRCHLPEPWQHQKICCRLIYGIQI